VRQTHGHRRPAHHRGHRPRSRHPLQRHPGAGRNPARRSSPPTVCGTSSARASNDTLSIELAGEQLSIKGGDSHFKIFTQNPAEFRPCRFRGRGGFKVQGKQLKQLISQTLFAAAKESCPLRVQRRADDVKNKRLILVATDGRRLALAKGDLVESEAAGDLGNAIVPAKTMNLVDKLISDPDEAISVKHTENQLIFDTATRR
jgi:DNA polymerase-3 subunit beta